jgi:hypothetical protein
VPLPELLLLLLSSELFPKNEGGLNNPLLAGDKSETSRLACLEGNNSSAIIFAFD